MGYFDSVTRCCCTVSGPCGQPVLVSRSRCVRCRIGCEIERSERNRASGARERRKGKKPVWHKRPDRYKWKLYTSVLRRSSEADLGEASGWKLYRGVTTVVTPAQMTAQPLMMDRNEVATLLPKLWSIGGRTMPIIMFGPPGTGKSSLAVATAVAASLPYYKVACSPDALPNEVIGGANVDDSGGWKYLYGPYLRACGEGSPAGLLIVDDIHKAGPGIQSALYTVLDSGPGGMTTLPNGRNVHPQADYRVICTMNGEPDELEDPILDRLAFKVMVMVPSEEMLRTLEPRIRDFVESDYDGTNPNPTATFRQWQSMSLAWPIVGLGMACLTALGSMERARKMLEVLAQDPAIPEARSEYMALVSAMRSGV
jgi:hypothetical protein